MQRADKVLRDTQDNVGYSLLAEGVIPSGAFSWTVPFKVEGTEESDVTDKYAMIDVYKTLVNTTLERVYEDSEYLREGSLIAVDELSVSERNVSPWTTDDNAVCMFGEYTRGMVAYIRDGDTAEVVEDSDRVGFLSLRHSNSSRRIDTRVYEGLTSEQWDYLNMVVQDRLEEDVLALMDRVDFPKELVLINYKNKGWYIIPRVFEGDVELSWLSDDEDEINVEDRYLLWYSAYSTTEFDDKIDEELQGLRQSYILEALEESGLSEVRELSDEGMSFEDILVKVGVIY